MTESIKQKLTEILGTTNSDVLNAVATDVYYSGDVDAVLADSELLKKLGERHAKRIEMKTAKAKVQAHDPTDCPICHKQLKPVKLDSGREAVWCSTHFVVFPVRSKS